MRLVVDQLVGYGVLDLDGIVLPADASTLSKLLAPSICCPSWLRRTRWRWSCSV